MPRRKDHTPEQLKALICKAATELVYTKGLKGLKARALAQSIGYTPGTIYNFYQDLDQLLTDINYITLEQMYLFCVQKVENLPDDLSKIRALINAYIEFAYTNKNAWEAVFAGSKSTTHLPLKHEQLLFKLFGLIEYSLNTCTNTPQDKLYSTARLLWVYVHGITVIALSGMLETIGITNVQDAIDDLIGKYLAPSHS